MLEKRRRLGCVLCALIVCGGEWGVATPAAARGPWHAQAWNTPGYEQMSPAERMAHQRRMRGMTRYEDCVEYEAGRRHRLRHRGGHAGGGDRSDRDPCEELRARGQLK